MTDLWCVERNGFLRFETLKCPAIVLKFVMLNILLLCSVAHSANNNNNNNSNRQFLTCHNMDNELQGRDVSGLY